jgi:hypothetical protein
VTDASPREPLLGWAAVGVPVAFVVVARLLGPGATLALYVAFNVLFNAPHQAATWVRAAGTPNRRRVVVVAVVFVVVSGALHALRPASDVLLIDALTYWGLWHLVAQHFGISQVLRARAGEAAGWRAAHRGYFVVLMGAGVVFLHATDPLTFVVAGDVTALHRLPFAERAREPVAVVAVVVFVVAGIVRLRAAARTNRARFTYEASSTVGLAVAFFAAPDVMIVTAALTSLHNVHYLALVEGVVRREPGVSVSRLRVTAVLYSLAIHALYGLSLWLGRAVFAAAVATHYIVDGWLWRLRQDARLARALGIGA